MDHFRDAWNQPATVIGLGPVRARAAFASGVVSAAIGDDGSLWVWGRSKRGQLGLGEDVTEAIRPSKVEALSNHEIIKVSFGWGHALALTKDGKLFGWGYCKDGRLGQMGQALCTPSEEFPDTNGSLEKSTSMLEIAEKLVARKIEEEGNMPIIWEPGILEELSDLKVSDTACGLDHSLILTLSQVISRRIWRAPKNRTFTLSEKPGDGTLLSCGDNTYGQLGRTTEGSIMQPIHVNLRPLSIFAGLGHSLAISQSPPIDSNKEPTSLFSWGWNQGRQLGRQGNEEIPALVEGLEGETLISAAGARAHSTVLTSKGEVLVWGSGRNGRLGLGSSIDEVVPTLVESFDGMDVLQVVSGFDHNLVLVAE